MSIRLVSIGMLAITVVSVGINIWQQGSIQKLRLRPVSVSSDEPYIHRAAFYWGQKNGTTTVKAMTDRYGKVIYFDGRACVSLELEAGGVGGVPVYCFDQRSVQLKGRYDNVE